MKEEYLKPLISVLEISDTDIICSSSGDQRSPQVTMGDPLDDEERDGD